MELARVSDLSAVNPPHFPNYRFTYSATSGMGECQTCARRQPGDLSRRGQIDDLRSELQTSMRDDLRAARLKAMGAGAPPAATLVGVQSLASEGWLVEIEVTAVIH